MNIIKRFSLVFVVVLILCSVVPVSAFAVDPITATAAASAFAQAITAYGASNGVSMMFDVSNTDGIGESVHELWKKYKEDNLETDDYLTIAQAVAPNLYNKVTKVVNGVSSAYVGVSLVSEYVEELDGFWNWVLSGPAEMVRVDNEFQWSLNQSGTVDPISVLSLSSPAIDGVELYPVSLNQTFPASSSDSTRYVKVTALSGTVYYFVYYNTSFNSKMLAFVSFDSSASLNTQYHYSNYTDTRQVWSFSNQLKYLDSSSTEVSFSPSVFRGSNSSNRTYNYTGSLSSSFSSNKDPSQILIPYSASNTGTSVSVDSISVQPYVGDAVPGDISIPDTSVPDYAPLPYDGTLDIPWNDTLYGDGSGVLSSSQTESIASDIDSVIDIEKTLVLEESIDVPVPAPSEVFTPLLPVSPPSFDFNFAGIWHYVREWVSSLGAWFSLVFTVWANLPYSLVVPVYATAVVVIVLGVYKRFFM